MVIQRWDYWSEFWLGNIQKLAVNVSLVATCMHRCTCGIFLMEPIIVIQHSTTDDILKRDGEVKLNSVLLHEAPIDEQIEHAKIWTVKRITIPPEMKSLVVIRRSKYVLLTREWIQTTKMIQRFLLAGGIHDVHTNVPFLVLATNLFKLHVILQMSMYTSLP